MSFDVSSATILSTLFTPDNVRRTLRRMKAWQESENEVSHPLRKMILIEYEDSVADGLSTSVAGGSWAPSPSYVVLVAKRSGTYRELAFPSLLDAVVGRMIIDALEPHITKDDNNRVFFGRSHANADRQRGDYENWFKVWLDYSSEIASALKTSGYTYVFDTDITQFFPSVDRQRAKAALAQRTRAHQTLLELLFYCLETWAPRVRYCAVPGLPIEPNDVSRLVAHNYIKGVDEHFVNDPKIDYLRWVDDTVIFAADEKSAHDLKRRHHLALREMGLSPNASKTSITTAEAYSEARHPSMNRRITAAQSSKDIDAATELVEEWYRLDRKATPNWQKVATRLYSLARQTHSDALLPYALDDVAIDPTLARSALKYLIRFPMSVDHANRLMGLYGHVTTSIETRIEVSRFLGDVVIQGDTSALRHAIHGRIIENDERLGNGYARALLLLCLNKHGTKADRDRLRNALPLEALKDDQLRLHYLYVYMCRGELDETIHRSVRHLDTPDISLTVRLCQDACAGALKSHSKLLAACISTISGRKTVLARHLPMLHALLQAAGKQAENHRWLGKYAQAPHLSKFVDPPVARFLSEELILATR